MLSDISVRRPVFAAVAAIILCVIGLAAFAGLPVRELPSVDPPVVSVQTAYRGASAEVVEERITQVIEGQVSGIQGIDRVNSSSRDGQSNINITFTLDRDLDAAANDVRDAVSRVLNQLPEQADAPRIAKADADATPIIILNMTSSTLNRLQMSDYADRFLVERLSTTPGVAQVFVGGAQLYAMRIWLDADAMAARGVTVDDVEQALNSQNLELPAGALESQSKDFTIRVNRNYQTPAQFAQMPIRASGEEGYVTDITWRTTAIRALANNMIMIPNSKLAQAIVTNFHLPEKRMSLVLNVGVSYDEDPDRIEQVMLEEAREAAGQVPGLLAEPAPAARFIPGFGDSSLNFSLIVQVAEFVDQFAVQSELRKRLLRRFRQEGIQIPYPTRTVHVQERGASSGQ